MRPNTTGSNLEAFIRDKMIKPNIIENKKYESMKRITKLEQKLKTDCARKNLKEIGGFTIMFDDESGRTIRFVEEMRIEGTGGMKELYDKDSEYFNIKYEHIEWPYTGFVQGNILGWYPISIPRLVEWLEKYNYALDEFLESFRLVPS